MKFDIYFKYILRKINFYTLIPSYLGNASFETITMDVKSPQPTILYLIKLWVCLYILYDQYVSFLD